MKAKHTLGPWHTPGNITGYTDCDVFGPYAKDGADYAPIARANTPANARLIAAAPELLVALREMLAHPQFSGYKIAAGGIQDRALRVIAKATGGAR